MRKLLALWHAKTYGESKKN